MDQEELHPQAAPAGRTRVQVLQERVDRQMLKIEQLADEIVCIGKEIRGLDEEKDAAKIKTREAQQAKMEAQQAEYKALMKDAQDELTGLLTGESCTCLPPKSVAIY